MVSMSAAVDPIGNIRSLYAIERHPHVSRQNQIERDRDEFFGIQSVLGLSGNPSRCDRRLGPEDEDRRGHADLLIKIAMKVRSGRHVDVLKYFNATSLELGSDHPCPGCIDVLLVRKKYA